MKRPGKFSSTNNCYSLNRRDFVSTAAATTAALALPATITQAIERRPKPVTIGLIADLHQDVMHDGLHRMKAFVDAMAEVQPDAILQLGDFAYPNPKNKQVIDLFNHAHLRSLHVIGNHDTDAGHTKKQCIDVWGMPQRYYAENIDGLWLLVLDGNDVGSPTHTGGYVSYVGEEQRKWLAQKLSSIDGPAVVVSHQPLAGPWAVDNAEQMQSILGAAADKVLLAICGHSHIDDLSRINKVPYMHINSASYQWVGGSYAHQSYAKEIHDKFPSIANTCPYRDSLFATLTFDPESKSIEISGRESQWVGQSPAELGLDVNPGLTDGEEIAPRIRDRRIVRVAKREK